MNQSSLEQPFLEMLEQHKKLVFKVANAYCKRPEDRKDLVQEIILQLWRAFPKYDETYAITTWMYRIALNVSISFFRKETTRKKVSSSYGQQVSLLEWQEDKIDERLQLLYQWIEQLKPLDKAIIILHLDGHSNPEISEIMGMSLSNVSTKINRIKNQLKARK